MTVIVIASRDLGPSLLLNDKHSSITKGDHAGHPFHGNQYRDGHGGDGNSIDDARAAVLQVNSGKYQDFDASYARGFDDPASTLKDGVVSRISEEMKSSTDDIIKALGPDNAFISVRTISIDENGVPKVGMPEQSAIRTGSVEDLIRMSQGAIGFSSKDDLASKIDCIFQHPTEEFAGSLTGYKLEGCTLDDVRAAINAGHEITYDLDATNSHMLVGVNSAEGDRCIRYEAVENLVTKWASTSNDTDPLALALQESAASEFNLPSALPWPSTALSEAQSLAQSNEATYADFLRTQYDSTQQAFAAKGFGPNDTMTLYRGMEAALPPVGTEFTGQLRPMSSFSTDPAVARAFAMENSQCIKVEVPISSILSVPGTGFGCYEESEIVVLGNDVNGTVISINQDGTVAGQ